MAELKDLHKDAQVAGIVPNTSVTVVDVEWFNHATVKLTYRVESTGQVGQQLLYDWQAPGLAIVQAGTPWAFDADGDRFQLALEAFRIRLAFLFDPFLGVTVSRVEPLPHQIDAVYGAMLKRQPLRFLLADDPGAGKTIMAGLLIKELMLRGELERCLIVAPASLAEQWQDELAQKFDLEFRIVGRGEIEQALGNPFEEHPLVISRIDLLKQDENIERLRQSDWDLVVVDEAHKMSASYDTAGDRRETARYRLGQALTERTRNYLLMTATPHHGKEADFQLFMALLDPDRFEGKYRPGIHQADVADLMLRRLKEDLVDFSGHRLFPERRAYTVNYALSTAPEGQPSEQDLYERVTAYVREQMGRADGAVQAADAQAQGAPPDAKKRRAVVGFALTVLQRRLASSPNAIYQSLARRRKRLEATYDDKRQQKPGAADRLDLAGGLAVGSLKPEDLDDDLEERPEAEVEQIVDAASAATTLLELRAEIDVLKGLEARAKDLLDSHVDTKWRELKALLQNRAEMFDQQGRRLKLVIFTEHKDTLDYLVEEIARLLHAREAIAHIHGGLARDERRRQQEEFVNNPDVLILVATDAAGEGINLQNAHLMVNYDLPWNPNRLEQRFGRIHRFGQTEMCFVWNLVAYQTREGRVFDTLFAKLEEMRQTLGGRVFDVLGRLFEGDDLRKLILDSILEGESPQARAYMQQRMDAAVSPEHILQVLAQDALNVSAFGMGVVADLREQMQRAELQRLVPYYIAAFFRAAFDHVGGTILEREVVREMNGTPLDRKVPRFEITHVPVELRRRADAAHRPLARRYERICFDKAAIRLDRRPAALFVAPGHPLLDRTLDLILERYGALLQRGAILADEREDAPAAPRALFCIRQDITDGRPLPSGAAHVVSSELHFIEIAADGTITPSADGPYLGYRALHERETAAAAALRPAWVDRDLEQQAVGYAIGHLVEPHFKRVQQTRFALLARTAAAVDDRLTKEILYWDAETVRLKDLELAGKQPRMNAARAAERRDSLTDRRTARLAALEAEKMLAAQAPILVASALVVPARLLPPAPTAGPTPRPGVDVEARRRIEALAMAAVMDEEERRGRGPRDVSRDNLGYDIEARDPATGRLRFIEVKGRAADADSVTVSRNECYRGLNATHDYILAVARVRDDAVVSLDYIANPFARTLSADPAWGLISVDLDLQKLLALPGTEKIR